MKARFYFPILFSLFTLMFSCEREDEPGSKKKGVSVIQNPFFNRTTPTSITLSENEGEFIDLATAQTMVNNFLKNQAELGVSNPKQAVFFSKEKLLKLLNKEGAAGLTFYFGNVNGSNDLSLIVTASDKQWSDITAKSHNTARVAGTPSEDYLDHGTACCPIGK